MMLIRVIHRCRRRVFVLLVVSVLLIGWMTHFRGDSRLLRMRLRNLRATKIEYWWRKTEIEADRGNKRKISERCTECLHLVMAFRDPKKQFEKWRVDGTSVCEKVAWNLKASNSGSHVG